MGAVEKAFSRDKLPRRKRTFVTASGRERNLELGGAMHLVVYISKYTGARNEIDSVLSDISKHAASSNKRLWITGLLFFHEGYFLQLIEGRKEDLEILMSKLERDPRHCDLHRIVDEAISGRSFEEWRMDSFNLNDFDKLDLDSVKAILDVYKRNYTMDAGDLILFFKLALESHFNMTPTASRVHQKAN